ncbi:Hypothetical predicted protein [Lecanosticta acicola]|uniref:Uncharacterized protein n=1 Tax=Lecanosticta acicola TaxID=111012 RepID=A0AAI8Z5E0_9PEZI|nr:Hypothetical predicted protein [Lecanosticta acicola]
MCLACLNVSTQPCSHRWYQLVRPCNPDNDLANCPERLKLEGWETRLEHCPFCDGAEHSRSTHRLFGTTSSPSSVASSSPVSDLRTTPLLPPGNRRGSLGTINEDIMGPLSRESSHASIETDRSQQARDMNDRIFVYLASEPHHVLPSAKKYYPTYTAAIARVESNLSSPDTSSPVSGTRNLRRRHSFIHGWKRMSGRLSISSSSLFKPS